MPDETSVALRSARLQISLVLVVLLAMLWGAITLHLGQLRQGVRLDGERGLTKISQAYGEQVTATVRAIDLSLLSLRDAWQRDRSQFTAAVLRQQEYLQHLFSVQVGVIDRDGRLAYSNLDPHPKPLDLSDREHYRVHATGRGDRLFISKPVLGRVSQKWSVQFTRPVLDARGAFAGVMVVSIAPDYLSHFAASAGLGDGGVLALLRSGGEYLTRFPEPERVLGQRVGEVPYLGAAAPPTGVFARVSHADGTERIYAWHRLDEFGLVAVAGTALAEIMAPYERERATYLLGGALLSALLGVLVLAMIQRLNLRSAAAAALEASESRYRTLVAALAEGVLLVDRDGRVLEANVAARAVFASVGSEPVGQNLLESAVSITNVDGEPLPSAAHPLVSALQQRRTTRDQIIGLAAPAAPIRWFRVSASPFAGSRPGAEAAVVSFSEVSAERQTQESQRLASAVIENAAEGVVVTDVQGKVLMVNPAFTAITGYAAADLIGGSLRLLRSGRHDQAFYAAMWESIGHAGIWQGEIWNKRKNGEIYPEWLTISAVHDNAGKVRHFIGVFSDISERKQREHRIWRQANFDALTDLPNRSYFNERLEQAIAQARRSGSALALLFLDLDHFKWVNDTLGHEAGNQLLRQAAGRMAGCLRAEDTLSRLSGDEFAVLLAAPVRAEDADVVARKLLGQLCCSYNIDERDVVITASVGIAMYPGDGTDGESLLKNADIAMYRAKEGGRNGVAYFTPSLHARAEERLRLASELRRALSAGEFVLHFQPVMDGDGMLRSAEALIRWQHPQRGLVGPAEFIGIAEEIGIIAGITAWVLPAALAQLQQWRAAYGFRGALAINLSSGEFHNREHLERLLAAIAEAAPEAGALTIEITESSLLDGDDTVLRFLDDARRLGARIALDDFGTGYSSLAYLSRFPFDIVKIDRQFVARLGDREEDLGLVEAIVAMARRLRLKVVAEGVETAEQRATLVAMGCDLLQGYLFGRPLPAEDFAARYLA